MIHVINWLHQAAILFANPPTDDKVDNYVIQPMYDLQHGMLRMIADQKQPDHGFSNVEVLLTECFQLYFWTAFRRLPPTTRLCEFLISRVMKALLPLLLGAELPFETGPRMAASVEAKNIANMIPDAREHFYRFLRHPREVNNAITWTLALGTMVTAPLLSPEFLWFKDHFQLQLRAMALHENEEQWLVFLDLFPSTTGFPSPWVQLKDAWHEHGV